MGITPRGSATFRAICLSACLVVATGFVPATAVAQPSPVPAAADAQRPATYLKVVIKTPAGVPAQVRVSKGPKSRAVVKGVAQRATKKVSRFKVRPGRYRVKAPRSVLNGREYVPVIRKKAVQAVRGRTTKVVVRWKPAAAPAELMVVGSTANSVSLQWRSSRGTAFMVRRLAGERAPASAKAGTLVYEGSNVDWVDSGLAAGSRYSYSVFVESKGRWRGPGSTTAGTVGEDPITGSESPSFSVSSQGVVVDAGDADVVRIRNGQVWVTYARSRPAPVVGAGIALPISDLLPGGYLGRVVEIAPGGREARLEPGALSDLFESYEADFSLPTGTQWEQLPGPVAEPRPLAALRQAGPVTSSGDRESGLKCEASPNFRFDVDGPRLVNKGGHFRMNVEKFWGVPHRLTYDLLAKPGVTVGVDLQAEASLSCLVGLGKFKQQVSGFPVPIAMVWEAGAEVSVSGSVGMRGSVTPYLELGARGAVGTGSFFDPTFKTHLDTSSGLAAEGNAEIALGGSLTLGPGMGNNHVGLIAGIKGELKPLKFGVATTDVENCFQLSLGGEASLNWNAQVWVGPLSTSVESPIFDAEWDWLDPWNLPDGCDEPEQPVVDCLNWNNQNVPITLNAGDWLAFWREDTQGPWDFPQLASYSGKIDWGDGASSSTVLGGGPYQHTYSIPGTFAAHITGTGTLAGTGQPCRDDATYTVQVSP